MYNPPRFLFMREIEKQVAILGGGCAGLWLLYELSKRGFSAIIIDHHAIGQFASTRNQSWLHTGALYAVSASQNDVPGLKRLAEACLSETPIMKRFCEQYVPEAIYSDSKCLFVFPNDEHRRRAAIRVHERNIPFKELNHSQIVDREPGLFRDQGTFWMEPNFVGLETEDFAFDSNAILAAVARLAALSGGDFLQMRGPLCELQYSRVGESWEIQDDQLRIRAQICVCASGALIPRFADMFGGQVRQEPFQIQKCIVAVLHNPVCENIVVFRNPESNYLNLVPFEGGTTVNMGAKDSPNAAVDDVEISPDKLKEFAEKLSLFAPGIKKSAPIACHFYTCQKLGNVNDSSHPLNSFGYRHYFWRKQRDNFYVFYPGKFTLSWAAARSISDYLADRLESKLGSLVQVSDPPPICRQPYFGTPTHMLVNAEGELHIE